jgi:hypothetical protein
MIDGLPSCFRTIVWVQSKAAALPSFGADAMCMPKLM